MSDLPALDPMSPPQNTITLQDQVNKKLPIKKFQPLYFESNFSTSLEDFKKFALLQHIVDVIFSFHQDIKMTVDNLKDLFLGHYFLDGQEINGDNGPIMPETLIDGIISAIFTLVLNQSDTEQDPALASQNSPSHAVKYG